MTLIGINGLKTSGKDTTYKLIAAQRAGVERAAFADKLKVMAAMALGFEGDTETLVALMDDAKDSWVFDITRNGSQDDAVKRLTGREYLQWFGGNARKVFGDTFWIDQVLPNPDTVKQGGVEEQMEHAMEARYPTAEIVTVTDVRYENEAERVKALGGYVIEVVRPGLSSDGHDSEKPLSDGLVDYRIINDRSIRDLERTVGIALESLGC